MTRTADSLNAALDNGMTVTVATAWRATRVTAKARNSWRGAGFEFFKTAADGSLLMIEGQSKGKPRYVTLLSTVHISAR